MSVFLEVSKVDTDNLRFFNTMIVHRDIYIEAHEPQFLQVLRDLSTVVSNAISNRHGQNINNCEHVEVMIGSKKGCMKCMGKFGEKMNIDFNWN